MARRKYGKKRRSGGSKKVPIAVVGPIALLGYQAAKFALAGDMNNAGYVLTGVNSGGNFNMGRVIQSYTPIAAGIVVHKIASRAGVNRYIPKWLPLSI